MDLRHRKLTAAQIEELHLFIRQRKLAYQPFIFTDTLQVGEGQRFRDGEFSDKCGEVLWEGAPPDLAAVPNLISKDAAAFQEANAQLRTIYDGIVDFIARNVGEDISRLSFAEFGCNTGYFLHSLAARGAGKTIGYDFTPGDAIFRWFNEVLGIPQERNEFRFAEWDSLNHCVRHTTFDEVDVCMSLAVTCHLPDPLHHLAFLCSKARKAVFFWCPADHKDDLSISFGKPGKYANPLSFPINFDNRVRISVPMLRLTLEQCGFGNLIQIEPTAEVNPRFQRWFNSQAGFLALRTSSPATLYAGGNTRRIKSADAPATISEDLPAWVPGSSARAGEAPAAAACDAGIPILVEQGYRAFNIVAFRGRFLGIAQSLGPLDLTGLDDAWLSAQSEFRTACAGKSLDEVKRRIDQLVIDELSERVQQLQDQLDQSRSPGQFAAIPQAEPV